VTCEAFKGVSAEADEVDLMLDGEVDYRFKRGLLILEPLSRIATVPVATSKMTVSEQDRLHAATLRRARRSRWYCAPCSAYHFA